MIQGVTRQISLADILKLVPAERVGPDVSIQALHYADGKSAYERILTFAAAPKYLRAATLNPKVRVIVTRPELVNGLDAELRGRFTFLLTAEPVSFFFELHRRLYNETDFYPRIGSPPKMGRGCSIDPLAVIERDVVIGDNVAIGPYTVVRRGTLIDDKVGIGANSVIGASGFELKYVNGSLSHVPHAGGVRIGKGVGIGSNTVIGRSLFEGYTVIGPETHIDNSVHISHEVSIGARTILCAGVNVAGSVSIGDDVFIGIGALVNNKISIGNRARVNMGAVVAQSVPDHANVAGFYAMPNSMWIAKTLQDQRSFGLANTPKGTT